MEVTGLVRVGLGDSPLGERMDGKVGRDRRIGRCGVGVCGENQVDRILRVRRLCCWVSIDHVRERRSLLLGVVNVACCSILCFGFFFLLLDFLLLLRLLLLLYEVDCALNTILFFFL